MPDKDYHLIINLDKDVIPTVKAGKYFPVVEILKGTVLKVLPDEQVNQWIELADRSGDRFPVLKDSSGNAPTVVEHDTIDTDGSVFEFKFQAPEPDSKVIWFAIHTASTTPDVEDAIEFDPGSVGHVIKIDQQGGIDKVTKDPAIAESAESVGLVIQAKMILSFWIHNKGDKPTRTEPHQKIELLPGTARLQLPTTASKSLQVKVWLEGHSDVDTTNELVMFQDQSHKELVTYSAGEDLQQISLTAEGTWKPKQLRRVAVGEPKKLVRRSTKLSERIAQYNDTNGAVNGQTAVA